MASSPLTDMNANIERMPSPQKRHASQDGSSKKEPQGAGFDDWFLAQREDARVFGSQVRDSLDKSRGAVDGENNPANKLNAGFTSSFSSWVSEKEAELPAVPKLAYVRPAAKASLVKEAIAKPLDFAEWMEAQRAELAELEKAAETRRADLGSNSLQFEDMSRGPSLDSVEQLLESQPPQTAEGDQMEQEEAVAEMPDEKEDQAPQSTEEAAAQGVVSSPEERVSCLKILEEPSLHDAAELSEASGPLVRHHIDVAPRHIGAAAVLGMPGETPPATCVKEATTKPEVTPSALEGKARVSRKAAAKRLSVEPSASCNLCACQ